MTFGNLLIFIFLLYLLFVVGKSVLGNFNSNKQIELQETKRIELEDSIVVLKNQINYYQTKSYKEKEARAKLGYKAPGESVMALPIDTAEEKIADTGLAEVKIKIPNYRLWWQYFFGKR